MDIDSQNMTQSQNTTFPEIELRAENVNVYYGSTLAVRDVNLDVHSHEITAFIGPSGCGKSTILRCFNRLNDLIPTAKVEGNITFRGQNLYGKEVDPVQVRRHIGMVFQKPNPFAKSIYDNIAYAARVNGFSGKNMDELVENALRQAALWDEVKDKLKTNGLSLSGGQQQRLCIARAIAIQPEVVLMDEPCSALDPISTLKIEELLISLKEKYTIIIVTHNMQQASRVSDRTAFFNARATAKAKQGYLVEYNDTKSLFQSPAQEATQQYVTGVFG